MSKPEQPTQEISTKKDQEQEEIPPFLVATLRGLRNGIYYGGKVRFVHGIVMAILFRKGSWRDAVIGVLENTYEHAKNLGCYVFIYKAITNILHRLQKRKSRWHAFVAGLIGGYIMFGKKTSVNYQITLYLLSRIVVGGVANIAKKLKKDKIEAYPILAACNWALVMYLFTTKPDNLQASLTGSMNFLYKETEGYKDWTDFVPVYVPDGIKNSVSALMAKK